MLKTYEGSCHCGAVRFAARVDISAGTAKCNCTVCRKMRLWSVDADEATFTLTAGAEALTDYMGRNAVAHHFFCTTCGIGSYAHGVMPDGTRMAAINVRCLDGVDVASIKPTPFDGRSL